MTVESSISFFAYKPGAAMLAQSLTGLVYLSGSNLVVYHIADATGTISELAEGADYTLGGNGAQGSGTITAAAAYPADDLFRVERHTSLLQPEEFQPFQDLDSAALERGLDRIALVNSDQARELDRAIKVPFGETPLPMDSLTDADGKVLAVANGRIAPIENTTAAVASDVAAALGYKDEAQAAAALTAADLLLTNANALSTNADALGAATSEANALAIVEDVSAALAAGTVSDLVGTRIYASKALLDADLVPADGLYALVIGDATAANNDLYKKAGATTTGSWTGPLGFFASASAEANAALAAVAALEISGFVRGTGDRQSSIAVANSTGAFFQGTGSNLVDGVKAANATDAVQFTGTNVGRTITFDFGHASRLVFNSFRLWWNGERNQGVVKAQGSVDGVTWTDLSGNLNWGQSLTANGDGTFYQDFTLTKPKRGSNEIGYRFFRIAGVSGNGVAIEFLLEAEFETTPALGHNSIATTAPVGAATQVLAKATHSPADLYWRDAVDDTGPRRMLADFDRLLASERYSEARFHADSIYGDDTKGGTSSALAKKTITGLTAMAITKESVVGLRAGSTFTDKTIEPATGLKKLIGFGEGSLPLLECAPDLLPGAFAASAGNANTYELTLTREALTYVNDPQYTMWEISGGVRKELVPRTSIALVVANPGSVYFVSRTGASSLTYVHPFGSTNPTSDGKTYKASTLKAGLGINGDSGATTNPVFDGQYIEGIHASGQVDGHGSILSGDDATMKRCLASYGNKHSIIFKSGYAEDSIAYGWGSDPVGGCIPWTVFRFDAKGRKAHLTRCMSITTETEKTGTAFYCHGSLAGGQDFDEIVLNQFVSVDIGGVTSSAKIQRYSDLLFVNLPGSVHPLEGVEARALQPLCEIDRLIFWAVRGTGFVVRRPTAVPAGSPSTSNILTVRNSVLAEQPGSGTVSGTLISCDEPSTINIENNVFLSQNNRSISIAAAAGPGPGSTITRNIFLGNRLANPQGVSQYPMTAEMTVDYNIYIALRNIQIQITNSVNNGTYTITEQADFAAYKAATGKDTNSLWLVGSEADSLFINGLAGAQAGDLRLNPNCALKFTDGSPVVENAGPLEHLDWNRRIILPGAPSRIPKPPVSLAQSEAYVKSPAEWDWYA